MTEIVCMLAVLGTRGTAPYDPARVERLISSLRGMIAFDTDGADRIEDTLVRLVAKGTPGVQRLIDEVNGEDYNARSYIESALGRIGDERAKMPLFNLIKKGEVRPNVTRALGRLQDERIASMLIEKVLKEQTSYHFEMQALLDSGAKNCETAFRVGVRTEAIGFTSCINGISFASEPFRPAAHGIALLGVQSEEILLELSASKDWRDRRGAAIGFDIAADEVALPILRKLAGDKVAAVRGEALATLGHRQDVESLTAMYAGLADKDVRAKALEALGKLQDVQTIPAILALKDVEPYLVGQALTAFESDEATVALRQLILESKVSTASEVTRALGNGVSHYELALLALERRPELANTAASVLARFPLFGIVRLETAVDFPDARVRRAVAAALEESNTEAAVPVLRRMLKDPDKAVVEIARYHLGRLIRTLGLTDDEVFESRNHPRQQLSN